MTDRTPEGMWTGWEIDEATGAWTNLLQSGRDGLGWNAIARVYTRDTTDEFEIDARVIYVLRKVGGVMVTDQPHSVYEEFTWAMGTAPQISDPLGYVQRFATSWATLAMEEFDPVAQLTPEEIEPLRPAIIDRTIKRLHDIYGSGDDL